MNATTFETACHPLQQHIDGLWIVDTHEHLPGAEDRRPKGEDVLSEWLTHYFSCDLVSAGLPTADLGFARDSRKDLMDRWARVEPYWHAARSTGYGRSLDLAAADLYGIEGGVTRDTIGPLARAHADARQRGGHYRYVLRDKSRIAVSVIDSVPDADPEFFVWTIRLDEWLRPAHRNQVQRRGQPFGLRIHSLGDYKHALELDLDRLIAQGAKGLKIGLAYQRKLFFPKVPAAPAEEAFLELFKPERSPDWRAPEPAARVLEDHLMHHLLALADQRGLTVQVHTGLQEGNGNVITDANPAHLTNLFLEYGNVRFDLFHMGYPYMGEMSALAKNFANVFIDMCWGHIISPHAARTALAEWLDAVPANKISAFGGDYCFVDGVYGHQRLARRNVAAALAGKVADGSFDLDRAREIATWLFCDTPARLFGVEDRLTRRT